jgi:predicted permease
MARCSPSSSPRRSLDLPPLCSHSPCSAWCGEFSASPCHLLQFGDWVGACSVLEESCTRTVGTSTKCPALRSVSAATATPLVLPGEDRSFWANLLSMIRKLVPILLLGLLAAAAASVLIGKEPIEQWMRGVWAYAIAVAAGIPAYVCEGGEVPLTAALLTMGVGIGPAFTFMQASVGTCLPTLMMLPKFIGVKLTVAYLAFWLVYSVASGILFGWIL